MNEQLNIFTTNRKVEDSQEAPKVVNVASVPQRSPFRYPGGKTWFVPVFRQWMNSFDANNIKLIEPFVGGGIISLTAAFENLAEDIIMVELDDEIAAVWDLVINEGEGGWLASKIVDFNLTVDNARKCIDKPNKTLKEKAFATILKNRIYHGGIIATGSGMLKNGENGRGILSRWYPETLRKRLVYIQAVRKKMIFIQGDGFNIIDKHMLDENAVFFIDPPYTIAGKRLYTHFDIDHAGLFALLSKVRGSYLITYNDAKEVRGWANEYGLNFRRIPMKTTHHRTKYELVISDNFNWLEG